MIGIQNVDKLKLKLLHRLLCNSLQLENFFDNRLKNMTKIISIYQNRKEIN